MKQRSVGIAALGTWAAFAVLGGCGKSAPSSGCEEAVANLAEKASAAFEQELGRAPTEAEQKEIHGNTGKTAKSCVADKWSPEALRCFQEGNDLDALEKCWALLSEQQRKSYFTAVGIPETSKEDLAKLELLKLINEGFPLWSAAHPDQACPAGLDDLLPYVGIKGQDPWSNRYRVRCGDKLPEGATGGLAASSDGPDGKPDTEDDVRSWR